MVKAATEFDLRSNIQGRVAISKFDKDGTVKNTGTGNMIDNRDAFGARLSLDWAIDDNNQLNFNHDSYSINDNRLNLGTASCNRDAFFGCHPDTTNVEAHIQRPVFISGTVSNTFDNLTFISNGTDQLIGLDATRSTDINTVRKSYDAKRQQKLSATQLEYITGLSVAPGDLELRVKATNTQNSYYQVDDNDHTDSGSLGAAGTIRSALQPVGMTIASLETNCFGTETNVQYSGSTECSRVETETNAFEINVASDFENHNFVVGAYMDNSKGFNDYSIQTTAYLLLNDFSKHPLSSMFTGGALDGYGGQNFYGVLAGQIGANAVDLGTAIATAGGDITAAGVKTVTDTFVSAITTQCAGLAGLKPDEKGGTCIKTMPKGAGGLINDQRTTIDSRAVYGEYYYTFMDNFKLTLGARYMDDRFETRTVNGLSDTAYNIGVTSNGYARGLRNSNTNVCNQADFEACWQAAHVLATDKNYADTYKGVLQYSYDQGMAYVSMTTGNRAGGANPDGSKFKGSKATSYEIGSKNILMDSRLKLNATLFRHEQDDASYSLIRVNSAYTEPHDIIHQGLQLDTQFFVTDSLVLAANILMTDSEFVTTTTGEGRGPGNSLVSVGSKSIDPHNPDQATSWSGAIVSAATPGGNTQAQNTDLAAVAYLESAAGGGLSNSAATTAISNARTACTAAVSAAACGVSAYNITNKGNILMNPTGLAALVGVNGTATATGAVMKEIGGNKVPGVSDMEATVSLSQFYQGAGGSGAVRLAYSFKDDFYGDFYNNERFKTASQEYIDLNATYEPNQGDWYLNLWAKNLADKRQMTATNRTSNLQGAVIFATYSEGMRAGLDFGINF